MIPKASQRGGGRDLATHLLNAFDNEYVEVAEVSGAIAADLHGAFAEWEAIATSLTNCRNYLYSLSVNPDPAGDGLTRAQYSAYLDRVEKALGLEGQPRAVVFHIKDGREHCHAVWSRIDWRSEKAIHLAFDREKLMMVTRQFAREHGLSLPDGYGPSRFDEPRRQASLYDRAQERATGISKEERMLMVTQAWRQSDTPRAFVRALEDMGYILATGDRPYVLVDVYGGMNALPRLIDDRSVRTKDIRAFLGMEFPPEALPSVDEARAIAAGHRKAREEFAKAREDGKRLEQLARAQAERRARLEAEQAVMRERQERERGALAREQRDARSAMRSAYVAETARVHRQRMEARATGLAAFLGRVTGMSAIIHRVQRYKDAQRYLAFRTGKEELALGQKAQALALQRRHEMQGLDMARQLKALGAVEARERRALDETRVREQRIKDRAGHDHMPALNLELSPSGRKASVSKAQNRYKDSLRGQEDMQQCPVRARDECGLQDEMARAVEGGLEADIDLRSEFARAAGDSRGEDGKGDAGGLPVSRAARRSERGRGRDDDFERER